MTKPAEEPTPERAALGKLKKALQLVCVELPHLSGLANAVRLYVDSRVPTAGITATGKLLVNPVWFKDTTLGDAAFIAAHELLHLCLQTHEREAGTEPDLFNWAHDYIINDILVEEMGQQIPKNGLEYSGARKHSAEQIVTLLRRGKLPGPRKVPRETMTIALQEAGLLPPSSPQSPPGTGDVIDAQTERQLFPEADPAVEERMRQRVREVAAKSLSLQKLKGQLENLPMLPSLPVAPPPDGNVVEMTDALRSFYRPPWEMVLQQWLEAVAPGPRTYVRPSRRGADRTDLVLPGRKREGWTLHIVLDTSGSMVDELPRLLGWIAAFCESVNVSTIHMLQCDVRVTVDEFVTPEELFHYRIAGHGGSDMSPGLLRLAEDPEVEAVLVLTDGYIGYPGEPLPYRLLWVLSGRDISESFQPPYGHVLHIPVSKSMA